MITKEKVRKSLEVPNYESILKAQEDMLSGRIEYQLHQYFSEEQSIDSFPSQDSKPAKDEEEIKIFRINRLSRECFMTKRNTVNHSYHKVVKYNFTKPASVKAVKEFVQVCLHMFFTALMMDAS